MDAERCPRCGAEASEVWTSGRRLMLACVDRLRCFWSGEPYTPPKQEIVTRRDAAPVDHSRWIVEAFDQYGHAYMIANLGGSRYEAFEEAVESIERTSLYDGYGECVAVVYAPGELDGVLVTREKRAAHG